MLVDVSDTFQRLLRGFASGDKPYRTVNWFSRVTELGIKVNLHGT